MSDSKFLALRGRFCDYLGISKNTFSVFVTIFLYILYFIPIVLLRGVLASIYCCLTIVGVSYILSVLDGSISSKTLSQVFPFSLFKTE